MGFISKVKSAVSKAYNKVDSAVGGRLPGGVPSSSGKTSSPGTTSQSSSSSSSSSPSSSSSSSGSSSRGGGGGSPSVPVGTPVGSAVGGGVLRSDGQGGTYVDKNTTPTQALKEISSQSPSSGKIGGSGKVGEVVKVKVTDFATPKEGRKTDPLIIREIVDKGRTLQSQVSSVSQSKVSYPPSGTPVGSAPGGGILVSDGKGGTKVVYRTRTERKQESFGSAYEKSIREQTGSTLQQQNERETKVKNYADKEFNYYQKLVNEGKISPEEATKKYNQAVSTYQSDLTKRDLKGATLAGQSLVAGGTAFTVIPSTEQERIAREKGKEAAGNVKFTKRDIILAGQGGVSFVKDVATAPSKGVAQIIRDVSYTAKEGKKIIKSPMSYQGGKALAIAEVIEGTKTSQAFRGFSQGVIGEGGKVGRGIIKTGFYIGDFGYKKITGKEPLAQAPSYFNYNRSRKISKDPDIRSAGVTVGTGFLAGGAFRIGGAVLKPVIGKTATTAFGTTLGVVAGGTYAYKVRSDIKLAEGTEAKGRVFGKATGEAALFGGGLYAGSRVAGRGIVGLTPRVYSEPLPVDVKVTKPVSVTGLPKQRNIYVNPQGKLVTLDKGFPVGYIAEQGVPGSLPRYSTPLREALGLKAKYVGGTANVNSKAYQNALNSLKKQGYTDYQARQLLRVRRPQYLRTTFKGELSTRQVEEKPFERFIFGQQTTRYIPGEKGGIKFLQKRTVVKQVSEQGTALGEKEIRFQTLEENFAKQPGKQTERFIGTSKGESVGEGEIGVFQGELNKLGIDIYKTGQYEAFQTGTKARKVIPSQRKVLVTKGLAFVQKGEPEVTIIDLSVSQARGFKGRGKPSSPEYFQKLYSQEQVIVIPSLKVPGVKKASSVKPSSQPSALKGSQATSRYGNLNVVSRVSGRVSGIALIGDSFSNFATGRVAGRLSQSPFQPVSATKQGQEEDQRVIRAFNVPYGKLPTYDISTKTSNPVRTFTKIQKPITLISQTPLQKPRESFRQPQLLGILPLAAQRPREALRQSAVVRQAFRLRQQVIQRQTLFQAQQFRNPFPTRPVSPNPFIGFPGFRPIPIRGAMPRPDFGRGYGRGGVRGGTGYRQYQYAPSLTSVLLGIGGTQVPKQQIFSGFEIRPAFFIPQPKKRIVRRRR